MKGHGSNAISQNSFYKIHINWWGKVKILMSKIIHSELDINISKAFCYYYN
jgi:hypothetical protein